MEIRKIFKAEIGHRLISAYSKRCLGLHGHSYIFEIFLRSNELDMNEMVIDFGKLKVEINNFIDSFDHSLLICNKDRFLIENAEQLNRRYIIVNYNPTAEKIAQHIFNYLTDAGLLINRVIVHETTTGCAICEKYDNKNIYEIYFSEQIRKEWK